MKFRNFVSLLGIGVLSVFLMESTSHAQEMPIPENVTQLAAPQMNAQGVTLGAFRLYPKLKVLGGYDDNILATESQTLSAGRTTVLPTVLLESNWASHELALAAFLKARNYPYETKEDFIDWGIGSRGRIDIREQTNMNGSINYQWLTEDRSGVDVVVDAPDPSTYGQFDINGLANHTFDQLTTSLSGSYTNLNYRTDNQSYRDRNLFVATTRLGYIFSPGYTAFVQGQGNYRDYNNRATQVLVLNPGAGAVDIPCGSVVGAAKCPYQDSTGYRVVAGVSSQLTDLIAGEVNVGYIAQNYESSRFKNVSNVTFAVNLTWFATPLTTVTVTGGRDVVDSTTFVTPSRPNDHGAGGIIYTTAGLQIEHDLLDELQIGAGFGYFNGEYEGTRRSDEGFRVNAEVLYMLNRYVSLEVKYRFDNRDSNVAGQGFDRNRVDFGFEFQL